MKIFEVNLRDTLRLQKAVERVSFTTLIVAFFVCLFALSGDA